MLGWQKLLSQLTPKQCPVSQDMCAEQIYELQGHFLWGATHPGLKPIFPALG